MWNDGYGAGGGGVSQVFPRPLFQIGVRHVTGPPRGTPDISLSAAVDGGVVVYYSFRPGSVGYHIFGGTSEASPLFSGIVALAAQKAHHSMGWINPKLYALAPLGHFAGVVDVTSGDISFDGVTGYQRHQGLRPGLRLGHDRRCAVRAGHGLAAPAPDEQSGRAATDRWRRALSLRKPAEAGSAGRVTWR